MPNSIQSVPIRSEEVQDILSDVPNWMIRWGSTLILLILLGLVLLSWMISYPDTVTGETIFTTAKQPAYLYSKVSGNLTKLYIEENELVKEGQLLAEIYNPVQKEQIDYLHKKLNEVELLLKGKADIITFDADEPSFGDIQANYNLLKGNINDFNQLQSSYYKTSIERLKSNINRYGQLSRIYKSKLGIASREFMNAEAKFKSDQKLYDEGVIARVELIDKESSFSQKQMEVENLKQAMVQNSLAVAELESQLKELLFSHEETNRKLKAGILSEKKIIENFIQNWKQGYAITAPLSGRAIFIEQVSEGQYINPVKPLLAITPENQKMLAKVKVPSKGYGKIREGQKVRFTLDNYPYQEYGFVYGDVQKKSYLSNDKMYELVISLPNELISSYGNKIAYKPNMTGQAEVIIEDQRLIEKLFYSLRKLIKQ